MTYLVSSRSLCLDACCSRFILLLEGEDEGEGLCCQDEGLLSCFLSHLTLFLSMLSRHASADYRGYRLLGLGRHL